MASKAEQAKATLIDRVVGIAETRLGKDRSAQTEFFLRAFYANVPPDDILGEEPETLFASPEQDP